MPRLSAVDVFKNLLEKLHLTKTRPTTEGALRFETLHYSQTGSETLPRSLANSLKKNGAELHPNSPITKVTHAHNLITGTNQGPANGDFISTLPLPHLIRSLDPPPPQDIIEAADQLRFKPMTVYALLVKKDRCMDALYTYYRDRIFHRVGEPKNAGLLVRPEGHTTLIVETTCEIDDPKWTGKALPQIIADLQAEGLCTPDEIVSHHLIHAPHAYPIFAKDFDLHLQKITTYLSRFTNLRSTGRQGAFTYPNIHIAMRMGATASEELLTS